MNLGKCCVCETSGKAVRNIITLDKKSPETKGGWGCFVCGLPSSGAVAVLCDECLEKTSAKESEIKFACLGYPGENRRIETDKLTEDFRHDLSKHPETLSGMIECADCGYGFIPGEEGGKTLCDDCIENRRFWEEQKEFFGEKNETEKLHDRSKRE